MKRELKVWNDKETEENTEPLVFWLDQMGSTVQLCVARESCKRGEGGLYYIGEIRKDGILYLSPSIPKEFGLQLDENGRIVVKNG